MTLTGYFEEPLEISNGYKFFYQMGDVLETLGYVPPNYFFHQCKDIISFEKHINNKGQVKFCFQAYFHNFPNSVLSINNNALGGIGFASAKPKLEKKKKKNGNNVVGYIHVNRMDIYHDGQRYDG